MRYRADIDGLRAVAILSVLSYHVWPELLPGGFIGVDVFFVISGYLISLQIIEHIGAGKFSIVEFYRRRIKRIAPALLAVVFTTVVAAELFLLPLDAQDVSRSAFASVLSAANVYFWLFEDTSYFAAATDEIPLLHLWSLGIEEQFYVLWPLILLALGPIIYRRSFILVLVVVIAASILFGQFYYQIGPSFVFYMLPARAGELMIGALVAVIISRFGSSVLPRLPLMTLGYVGLAIMAISLVKFSGDQVFPGFRAVLPTIGTAFLILSGHFGTFWPNRVLANGLFTRIGLVSYSAYLWHWPILAFLRYGRVEISPIVGLGLMGLTFLIATASYRYIEIPCRRSRGSFVAVLTKQFVLPASAVLSVFVLSEVSNGQSLRWFAPNYMDRLEAVRDTTKPAYRYDYVCQRQRVEFADFNNADCWIGQRDRHGSNIILFGDSNAAQYVGILAAVANDQNFGFYNVAIGSCPPIMYGLRETASLSRLTDCEHSLAIAWQAIEDFDTVILGGSWIGYAAQSADFLINLTATIDDLAGSGKRVIILGRTPLIHGYDLRCREKAISFPFKTCDDSYSVALDPDVRSVNSFLKQYSSNQQFVDYFDVNALLCPQSRCEVFNSDGTPRYFDEDHITLEASWRIGEEIVMAGLIPPALISLGRQDTRQ